MNQHTHKIRHGGIEERADLVQVAKWDITGAGSVCGCTCCSSCNALFHQPRERWTTVSGPFSGQSVRGKGREMVVVDWTE